MPSILVRPHEMMDAMDSPEASAKYVHDLASSLVRMAEQLGVSLRIDRVPHYPLAMGNAGHRVEAWPARHGAKEPSQ